MNIVFYIAYNKRCFNKALDLVPPSQGKRATKIERYGICCTHSSYYARLDRWYLLHASKYDNFMSCTMHMDHDLQILDHTPIWLDLHFGNHSYEVHLQRKRLMLNNNNCLKAQALQEYGL